MKLLIVLALVVVALAAAEEGPKVTDKVQFEENLENNNN